MCFNQDGSISSLNGKPLKLVEPSINLGSNISSTENDVNSCIGKAWTTIDKLTTLQTSDPFDISIYSSKILSKLISQQGENKRRCYQYYWFCITCKISTF